MGEAKLRGSFEERKKAAIKRNEKARLERMKKLAEIERRKTPEQKKAEKEKQMLFAQWLGIGLSSNIYSRFLH